MESLQDFLHRINKQYIKLNNTYLIISFNSEFLQFNYDLYNRKKDKMQELDKKRLLNLFINNKPIFLFNKDSIYILVKKRYEDLEDSDGVEYSCHISKISERDEYFSLEMEKSINFPKK